MRKLENLIPPPAVLLITLLLTSGISGVDNHRILRLDTWPLNLLFAGLLVIVGVGIAVLAIKQFQQAQTTVNPLRPASASRLVTSGVFKLSRNPMYLGMVLVVLSSVVFYGSAWCLLAVAAFIAFISRFQIVPEERAMKALFGDQFDSYKLRTRRWV
ncbi:MAG: protein-S-isoprenylcysteine O-methyltransferase Ste14 [Arenicella sp.]|jgi:protein-S-isoprenylcysteine O-methyltransferase Ste14